VSFPERSPDLLARGTQLKSTAEPQLVDFRGKRPVAPDPRAAYIPSAFPVIVDDDHRPLLRIAG
jgi:hypothetical protein